MSQSLHLPYLIALAILDEEDKLKSVRYMIFSLFCALLKHYHYIVTLQVRFMDLETGPARNT